MADSLWTYKDAKGVDVIVQTLQDVPAQLRSKAKLVDAIAPPTAVAGFDVSSVHWPSFAAGAAGGLIVALLVMIVLKRVGRLVLGALAIAAIAMGYLTFVRQQAGLGGGGVATPTAIIDEAKAAAEALQKTLEKQNAALKDAAGEK